MHFALRAPLCGLLALTISMPIHAQEPDFAWPPAFPAAEVDAAAERQAVLPPSVTAERTAGGNWDVRLRYRDRGGAAEVLLVGSFNGWSAAAEPMAKRSDGPFEARLELEPGLHSYKFVVDGRWIADPENEVTEDDGFGASNSVLALGAAANLDAAAASVSDGSIEAAALEHRPDSTLYLQHLTGGEVQLRYRTLAGDAETVELALSDGRRLSLERILEAQPFDWWQVRVEAPPAERSRALLYTFVVADAELTVRHCREFELPPDLGLAMRTPDWAKHAVWYQIMLDRFRNGNPNNDPPNAIPWDDDWYARQSFERGPRYRYVFERLFGGDLEGLRQALPYLKDLGVNALYLNPVFQASTHHKYNATNFLHVDERFGPQADYAAAEAVEDLRDPETWTWTSADLLFRDVLKEAKALGFRVVLDGVWNHVGEAHPAFRDVRERGAASPYKDWFQVSSYDPFEYEGWAGFGELPVFKKNAQGVFFDETAKRHIFEVTRRWMDPDGDGDPADGIDGWRLDVPMELGMPFWFEWCEFVRSINPEAYISGEVWDRAESWLDGRSFDAVMNYPFAEVAMDWIGHRELKISAAEAERRLAELRLAYPAEATGVLQNLLASHDTDRFVSMLLNPDRLYDRENREQDNTGYDASKPGPELYARLRLAALLQMTYVGAPMIYYGDEVGMWGSDDPNNRKPMWWSDGLENGEDGAAIDDAHLAFYREAVALRHAHPALRTGSIRTVLVDDAQDVWIFLREDDAEQVLVALCAGDEPASVAWPEELGEGWTVALGAADAVRAGQLLVPAVSGAVLVRGR